VGTKAIWQARLTEILVRLGVPGNAEFVMAGLRVAASQKRSTTNEVLSETRKGLL